MSIVDEAPPASTTARPSGADLGPARAVAGRALRSIRGLTIGFACGFALYSYIQPVGYRHTYPTPAGRLAFAHSFANNKGLRVIYGAPHVVETVAGYTAWRVGGTLAITAALYGLFASVRVLRAEEDAGRTELVLAGMISRRAAYLSAMAAIGVSTIALWLAELAGFIVGGLPVGGSAYLALATASVIPVLAGVGALVSQLAPSRRLAYGIGGATVALFLLLRTLADTASGVGWLRWFSPLGWAEELRPFSGVRPVVLFLPLLASAGLVLSAGWLSRFRDIGSGLLRTSESAEPNFGLLGSPTAEALRSQRGGLIAWTGGVAAFAFILGVVSGSVSSAGISQSIEKQFAKLGSGSILTPTGYLAFVFIFVMFTASLFACAQIGSVRREEADQQLETLLALPISREAWLGGRLVIATCAIAGLSVAAGLFAWAGAVTGGVSISLRTLLEAGANCIPPALLFLGLAVLAYAIFPRASAGIAYGIVTASFLWQTVGSLVGAPKWLVDLSAFAQVGLVPTQTFRAGPAAVMIVIGTAAAVAGLAVFRRRDLIGA